MVWFSYHGGHSGEFCDHAKSTLEEVIDAAIAGGFTHYGVSEHCPRYREVDLYPGEERLGLSGLADAFERYATRAFELRDARAEQIELLIGFETETLPPEGWLEAMTRLRKAYSFDYIVGSVHDICGRWVDYSAGDTATLAADLGGPEALHLAYFDAVTAMVEQLKPEIVAHLDLVRKYEPPGFVFSERVVRKIHRTLEAIRANGAVLDVNCAAFRNGYGPVYPLAQILESARQMDIPVTLGDDSHGVDTVGVGLDESLTTIAKAGYRSVAYLTRADGWREAPIDTIRPRFC